MVHKEVACYHSKVLDAAFNGSFIESQTKTYELEDTSEEAFRLLMQWLYSQKLVLKQLNDSEQPDGQTSLAEDKSLVELWVLADRLGMPRLKNFVLKAIYDISEKWFAMSASTFSYIYEHTAPDSLLRQYTVASCASINAAAFEKLTADLPHQMLMEFSVYMLKRAAGLEKEELDITDYLVKED
jgi:BTB/POZ domain